MSVYSLVHDANKSSAEASKAISDYREHQINLEKRISALEAENKLLRDRQERVISSTPKRTDGASKEATRR